MKVNKELQMRQQCRSLENLGEETVTSCTVLGGMCVNAFDHRNTFHLPKYKGNDLGTANQFQPCLQTSVQAVMPKEQGGYGALEKSDLAYYKQLIDICRIPEVKTHRLPRKNGKIKEVDDNFDHCRYWAGKLTLHQDQAPEPPNCTDCRKEPWKLYSTVAGVHRQGIMLMVVDQGRRVGIQFQLDYTLHKEGGRHFLNYTLASDGQSFHDTLTPLPDHWNKEFWISFRLPPQEKGGKREISSARLMLK